jgi:hypothetical protein
MFPGGTLSAVGGWLCPWQRGPSINSDPIDGVPNAVHPVAELVATRLWLRGRSSRVVLQFHTEGSNTSFIVMRHELSFVIHRGTCGGQPEAGV